LSEGRVIRGRFAAPVERCQQLAATGAHRHVETGVTPSSTSAIRSRVPLVVSAGSAFAS
jgi:hypothetical protein